MREPHTHDWHYNDAKEIIDMKDIYYTTVRFCKQCGFVEEIVLTEDNK